MIEKSEEQSFMESQLQSHGSQALQMEVNDLKEKLGRVEKTMETLVPQNGGQIALPYLPTGAGSASGQKPLTRNVNYFEDGTLISLPVYTANGGSPFGPF